MIERYPTLRKGTLYTHFWQTIMSVLVPIADGSEEIETVCIVDTLVRAGAKVTLASVTDSLNVVCSRGVKITADVKISGHHTSCILSQLP